WAIFYKQISNRLELNMFHPFGRSDACLIKPSKNIEIIGTCCKIKPYFTNSTSATLATGFIEPVTIGIQNDIIINDLPGTTRLGNRPNNLSVRALGHSKGQV